MKTIELKKVEHDYKMKKSCPFIEPNVTDDSLLVFDGEAIGFYLKSPNKKVVNLLEIANNEFLSKRVPKEKMARGPVGGIKDRIKRAKEGCEVVEQYSTVIGSVAPKPHMRRNYKTRSRIHIVESAKVFIKAMLFLGSVSELLVADIMPKQYEIQKDLMSKTPSKWRIGDLYTSSISNYNISANFHRDNANAKNTVNSIFTKRKASKGGCLFVPDYNVCFEQADNSVLVYPAWMNVHGVTPIKNTHVGGYRNTFIFYPLNAFME